MHDEKSLNLYKKACELVFKKIAFYEKKENKKICLMDQSNKWVLKD